MSNDKLINDTYTDGGFDLWLDGKGGFSIISDTMTEGIAGGNLSELLAALEKEGLVKIVHCP